MKSTLLIALTLSFAALQAHAEESDLINPNYVCTITAGENTYVMHAPTVGARVSTLVVQGLGTTTITALDEQNVSIDFCGNVVDSVPLSVPITVAVEGLGIIACGPVAR